MRATCIERSGTAVFCRARPTECSFALCSESSQQTLFDFVAGSSKTGISDQLEVPFRVTAHLSVSGGLAHQARPITLVLYMMASLTVSCSHSQVKFPRQPMACNCRFVICPCASNCRCANGQAFAAYLLASTTCWQPVCSCTHFAATYPCMQVKLHVDQMSMHMSSAHIKLLMWFERSTAKNTIALSSTASSTKKLTQQNVTCCRRCIRLEYRAFFRMPVCCFIRPFGLKGCGGQL